MAASGRLTGIMAMLALSLSGMAPALAETAQGAAPAERPVVTLAQAERGWIEARVPVSGSLVARQEVQVHALVSGHEITGIEAEVGDSVTAGQVLARLSEDVLSAQLAQAEAEYQRAEAGISQAESQIASTQASLTQAVAVLDRTRSLRQSGNASQAVLDQAIATEASARAALASASDGLGVARAALAQAHAARRIARLNLDHARITAPVAGVVVARSARLGAIPGGEPLFTLIAAGEVELEADVIETALSQLQPGDAAEIEVAGLGRVQGRLRLSPAAVDPVTRLGQARIALDPVAGLRPGLFASGWVITDRRQAVTVPASAVLVDASGERVQVVKDGRIDTREVRAGQIWQGRREILEGVEAGEAVVARAGAFFRSGDQVQAAP